MSCSFRSQVTRWAKQSIKINTSTGYVEARRKKVCFSFIIQDLLIQDLLKEAAASQNDEMETTVGVQDKVRTKGRGVIFEDTDDKGVKLKFRWGKVGA
ncbi:hypothetical protein Tco_0475187 [Tanacetum coccineum]